ncbi:MAG: hypothetical protein ABSF88_07900 [Candidatus Aminicenantales bacterium]
MISSAAIASLSASVPQLLERHVALWRTCENDRPHLGRTFTAAEQSVRGKALKRFVDELRAETKRSRRRSADRDAAQKRIMSAFEIFARRALDWEDRHIRVLIGGGFERSAAEFFRMAKQFDPGMNAEDIFQALRNVWVMNGLQSLLGIQVHLTPAIFAYSMLYPYTDNYLDDAATTEATKMDFNERFRRRLEGQEIAGANQRENAIFDLVAMIEKEYERALHPQVFESLLAIHRAQVRSLRLLRGSGAPSETEALEICLEKGGTSVLADGCLVAGSLAPDQIEFTFGLGAFLQLLDDQEDVPSDSEAGLLTFYSLAAGRSPLDALTNHTLCFGARVYERLDAFGAPGPGPLKELLRSVTMQTPIISAGRSGRFYGRSYLGSLEAHSPFRFSFSNKQRRKLFRRRSAFMRLFDGWFSSEKDRASIRDIR